MAKALHEQAAEYIRSRILTGEYAVGSQIPTENELCALLGVSRPTLRQALDTLAREGWLQRLKGKGTFVTEPKVTHESTRFITGYRAESEKNHRTLRTRVLEIGVERAPEAVARALHLPAGAKVTRLVRLRHLEGYRSNAPVVYTTLYVPCALFPEMAELDFTDLSFYEVLADRGLEVRHASRQLEVEAESGSVTLLYKFTVTGDVSAAYTITDPYVTVVSGELTGKLETTTEEIYVTKTFYASDVQNGVLTNTATITAGADTEINDEDPGDNTATVPAVVKPDGPTDTAQRGTERHSHGRCSACMKRGCFPRSKRGCVPRSTPSSRMWRMRSMAL